MNEVRAKVDRAKFHYEALDTAIGEYFSETRRHFEREHDSVSGMSGFRNVVDEQPPAEMPLIVGDFLHNLRSSLDYIAWQLVEADGKEPGPRTAFPIWDSRSDSRGKPRELNLVPAIGKSAALKAIDEVQPYQRSSTPERHPMAMIRDLSNWDKHRSLRLTNAGVLGVEVRLIHPTTGNVVQTLTESGPFGENALVGLHRPNDFGVADLKAEVRGDFFVGFAAAGSWDGEPVLTVLGDCWNYVDKVVLPKFESLI